MTARRMFLLVAAAVLLSRLPFLGAGYGWDSDAWRVAGVAHWIGATGHYAASRFPGNPVHELLCVLLARGGPWALNGISALASAIGAGCFALLLRRLGVRQAALGAFALASTPAFYLASVTTMDYALTLGLLLAALERAHAGRARTAGLLLGLAIGCRITTAAMILPLGWLVAGADPGPARRRNLPAFGVTALGIGALAFIPVALAFGWQFFRYYDHGYPSPLLVIKKATLDFWGAAGAGTLAAILLLRVARRPAPGAARALPRPLRPEEAGAWGLGCAIGVLTFLSLPYKPAYLLPALPFAILLLARLLSPRAFAVACLALVVSPWVFLVEHGQVRPARGMMPRDHERRLADMEYVRGVLGRAGTLERPSVVVAHDWQPQIRVRAGGDTIGPVRFVYLLTPDELAQARADGVRLYYLAGAEEANARERGANLEMAGATPL